MSLLITSPIINFLPCTMTHKRHLSFLFLAAKQLSREKKQGLLGSPSAMNCLLFHSPTQSAQK